jgi:hypothetical protein
MDQIEIPPGKSAPPQPGPWRWTAVFIQGKSWKALNRWENNVRYPLILLAIAFGAYVGEFVRIASHEMAPILVVGCGAAAGHAG